MVNMATRKRLTSTTSKVYSSMWNIMIGQSILINFQSWEHTFFLIWFLYQTLCNRCAQRGHTLQWHHNGRDGVSNHQPHDCLLNRLFRRRSKKTSKLCVTGLCAGNSPVTGEFPTQMASNAENVSIWWRHHDNLLCITGIYELLRTTSCSV